MLLSKTFYPVNSRQRRGLQVVYQAQPGFSRRSWLEPVARTEEVTSILWNPERVARATATCRVPLQDTTLDKVLNVPERCVL